MYNPFVAGTIDNDVMRGRFVMWAHGMIILARYREGSLWRFWIGHRSKFLHLTVHAGPYVLEASIA